MALRTFAFNAGTYSNWFAPRFPRGVVNNATPNVGYLKAKEGEFEH